jgi:hypothetical protein
MKLKSLLTIVAGSALLLSACGGGSTSNMPVPPAIDAAPHIKGTVDSTAVKATTQIGGGVQAWNGKLWLWAMDSDLTWDLHNIPDAKGVYPCAVRQNESDNSNLYMEYWRRLDGGAKSYRADASAGSSCSITVLAVSDKEVSGTFTATMLQTAPRPDTPVTIQVTNASFRVPKNGQFPD